MKISAGVSNVKLCGKLRCVLHLADLLPLVAAVELTFLQVSSHWLAPEYCALIGHLPPAPGPGLRAARRGQLAGAARAARHDQAGRHRGRHQGGGLAQQGHQLEDDIWGLDPRYSDCCRQVRVVTAPSVAPRLLVPRPQGVLRLTVVEAANLPQTDFGGLFCIDPYCSLQVTRRQ